MDFPLKSWEKMTDEEKAYFRELPEEKLRGRWESNQGREIIEKIVEINLRYGNSEEYTKFIGTVKTGYGKEPPKFDLRGINFSDYSNSINDEIFGFDFSNCSLHYANFSNSHFSSSNFSNSDLLYCDFSCSKLDGCNFSRSNLTLSDFSDCFLESSNFKNSWITDVNFENSNLGFVKFNRNTDFHNFDASSLKGSSNPLFISFIRRKHFLKHFKEQSHLNKIIYYVWLIISDCGQSFFRWLLISLLISISFGYIYSWIHDSFIVPNARELTGFSFYYYSIVTFTTLGFGDIVPRNLLGEILVTLEVVLGYIMLGGLLSIFATKFIPRH